MDGPETRSRRRSRWVWLGIVGGWLLALAVLLWWLWPESTDVAPPFYRLP